MFAEPKLIMIEKPNQFQKFQLVLQSSIQENNSWPVKEKVGEKSSAPRSCIVETEMGTERRRNREQLLVTNEQFQRVPTHLEDGSHSTSSIDNHVPLTNTNPLPLQKGTTPIIVLV